MNLSIVAGPARGNREVQQSEVEKVPVLVSSSLKVLGSERSRQWSNIEVKDRKRRNHPFSGIDSTSLVS